MLEPEIMPASVCGGVKATHTYQDESNRIHTVEVSGTVLHFKYLSAGSLSYSKNNVYCTGDTVTVAGKQHDGVVEMKIVNISVETVNVIVNPTARTMKDLNSERNLPYTCVNADECQSSDYTYIFFWC